FCFRAHRDLHSFPTRRSSDLEGREPGEPYAFALDADGLHDAIDFIGRRGMNSTINLLGGVVRVHDPQMRRILFLPTIERSRVPEDRKSTRLNSSHVKISYAVF